MDDKNINFQGVGSILDELATNNEFNILEAFVGVLDEVATNKGF